jgi:hypothetical protein
MFDADTRAAVGWGLIAAAALVGEHICAWPYQRYWGGFRRPVPYLLGTATLLAAFGGWATTRRHPAALRAATIITACGGGAVLGAYSLHAALSAPPAAPPVPVRPAGVLEGPWNASVVAPPIH